MTTRNIFDLTGRSALVTGAAGGIGAAVAAALAAQGAAVLVTDIDGAAAAVTAEKIVADGGRAAAAALDVRDRAAADAAASAAAELAGGTLHIVVNNAGATEPAMFGATTEESVLRMLDIHLLGAFRCTQAALAYLATDGTGRVINVTSSAGLVGTLGQVNYSAAKSG
ncbi:SDR family NAD(P)-dependent oxidoreductase, partial [Nocardia sp. NPDC060220]|uniref:SDR family NAD(P)-dependent oxidoreductase n=1 Tax=Nocardia sp. NPDC060220 TaxID=3347076 RepID=UPI00364A488D